VIPVHNITTVGFVNYEQVAAIYQQGREPLARPSDWGSFLAPLLPGVRPFRVLDLGAGTGIFARVWPQWGASVVVAIDPSRAMLAQAKDVGLGMEVHPIVAVGERLPLGGDTIDVAWLSAVIHHIADRPACARELRRVVSPGGRLFIRGFFAGLSQVGWLRFFPGADRAVDRFPTIDDIDELFSAAGFSLVVVEEALEPATPVPIVIEWLIKMRNVDSLLTALSDAEFDAGLASLGQTECRSLSGALHLAVFE
jgi:SAM-dependent methyltransferase